MYRRLSKAAEARLLKHSVVIWRRGYEDPPPPWTTYGTEGAVI